jgi:hypothetical protein
MVKDYYDWKPIEELKESDFPIAVKFVKQNKKIVYAVFHDIDYFNINEEVSTEIYFKLI